MGPCFIPPNNPQKLATWCHPDRTPNISDFFFIRDTLAFYPEGFINHPENIYVVRPSQDWHMNSGVPKSIIARIA
jgi:hypothetical protein